MKKQSKRIPIEVFFSLGIFALLIYSFQLLSISDVLFEISLCFIGMIICITQKEVDSPSITKTK